jgi:hypothetical protein
MNVKKRSNKAGNAAEKRIKRTDHGKLKGKIGKLWWQD